MTQVALPNRKGLVMASEKSRVNPKTLSSILPGQRFSYKKRREKTAKGKAMKLGRMKAKKEGPKMRQNGTMINGCNGGHQLSLNICRMNVKIWR
jgi:hypothetical protein